jgi:hypothetical protein
MTKLSEMPHAQLSAAFTKAGMGSAAQSHGNVFNQLRVGAINEVVGTLKAGCSAKTHKDARRLLRKALRELGAEI